MKQIEINGMVYEFDEKLIFKQEIRVGQNVQVLISKYGDTYEVYPGVVTQILPFDETPVVEVVYVESDYNSCRIKTVIVREGAKNAKILAKENSLMMITKEKCEELLNNQIFEAEENLRKAKASLEYFKKYFGMYFSDIKGDKEDGRE